MSNRLPSTKTKSRAQLQQDIEDVTKQEEGVPCVSYDDVRHKDGMLALELEISRIKLPSPLMEILARLEGQYKTKPWRWLVLLEDGQCAYITVNCYVTGFKSRVAVTCEAYVAPTMNLAVHYIYEADRSSLIEQLPAQTRRTLTEPP